MRFLCFILFMLFGLISAYPQCSMCRAVVEGSDSSITTGLNNGILYLMSFPYLIVISIGIAIYFQYNKKKKVKNETNKILK